MGTVLGKSNTGCSLMNQDAPVGAPVKRKNFLKEVNFGMVVYSSSQHLGVFQCFKNSKPAPNVLYNPLNMYFLSFNNTQLSPFSILKILDLS